MIIFSWKCTYGFYSGYGTRVLVVNLSAVLGNCSFGIIGCPKILGFSWLVFANGINRIFSYVVKFSAGYEE